MRKLYSSVNISLSGGGKIGLANLLITLFSLALSSCTDLQDIVTSDSISLQLNVRTAALTTRGLIESSALPDGSTIGLMLVDGDADNNYDYDGISYDDIIATASTGAAPQTWTLSRDVLLSSTSGTLYGYYPHNPQVQDIAQVPVTAGQTDYMYATPVDGLSSVNYTATIVMRHALAAIRLNIVRGTYTGTGSVTAVSMGGGGIATSAQLNAITGTLSALSGTGTAVTDNTAFTLSTTARQVDFAVVPVTALSAAPVITVVMDGTQYTATPDAVTLQQGFIYTYTLTVDDKDMSLSSVTVGDWGYNDSGNPVISVGHNISLAGNIDGIAFSNTVNDDGSVTIKAVPNNPNGCYVKKATYTANTTITQSVNMDNGILTINISNISSDITLSFDNVSNVYAVTANKELVTIEDADESCIAVALVVGEHQFWIEKNETNNTTSIKAAYTEDGASNTSYTYFYWGMYNSDNTSITNYTQTGGGGTSSYGYLPQANGSYASSSNNLSGDYTTWTSGALSDFNGKANTAALLAASDTDSYTTYANMATWCRIFNQTATENQGYTDWYIPACGQLSLMYLNVTAINNALTKIGGTTLNTSRYYWSSSEYSSNYGWSVGFDNGCVSYRRKDNYSRVRFVRDFVSYITFTASVMANDVTFVAEEGMTWQQWVDSDYNTGGFYISDNQISCSGSAGAGYRLNDVLISPSDVIVNGAYYTCAR